MSPRHDSGDVDITFTVLPLDGRRNEALLDSSQIFYSHGASHRSIDNCVGYVLHARPVVLRVTDPNVILFAFLPVNRGHGTTHGSAEGSRGGSGVQPVESKLGSVEIYEIFRSIFITAESNL